VGTESFGGIRVGGGGGGGGVGGAKARLEKGNPIILRMSAQVLWHYQTWLLPSAFPYPEKKKTEKIELKMCTSIKQEKENF